MGGLCLGRQTLASTARARRLHSSTRAKTVTVPKVTQLAAPPKIKQRSACPADGSAFRLHHIRGRGHGSFCEGFRMTARRDISTCTGSRRPKASREGTRGKLRRGRYARYGVRGAASLQASQRTRGLLLWARRPFLLPLPEEGRQLFGRVRGWGTSGTGRPPPMNQLVVADMKRNRLD